MAGVPFEDWQLHRAEILKGKGELTGESALAGATDKRVGLTLPPKPREAP